jgi:putative tRNA adenosine deaminase-associated protein
VARGSRRGSRYRQALRIRVAWGEILSTFAAAAARGKNGWTASELDLSGYADIDEVVDGLRDADPDAELSLLFVETDDLYLVILRLDEGDELRVFGSDSAFAEESRIGKLLLGEIEVPVLGIDDLAVPPPDDDEDERSGIDADADPVGDFELLADLGISSSRLLALCAHEGMLPADVTAEICQRLGCADELDELREA